MDKGSPLDQLQKQLKLSILFACEGVKTSAEGREQPKYTIKELVAKLLASSLQVMATVRKLMSERQTGEAWRTPGQFTTYAVLFPTLESLYAFYLSVLKEKPELSLPTRECLAASRELAKQMVPLFILFGGSNVLLKSLSDTEQLPDEALDWTSIIFQHFPAMVSYFVDPQEDSSVLVTMLMAAWLCGYLYISGKYGNPYDAMDPYSENKDVQAVTLLTLILGILLHAPIRVLGEMTFEKLQMCCCEGGGKSSDLEDKLLEGGCPHG